MDTKISIIVPIYNVESYIAQCLDSLINQTMREIEIICVNDGSKDGSLPILNEYAAKDDRIIVIDQPNSGVSIARNNALKHVLGEYFMFVDSDDWLDLNTCEVAYSYAMTYKAECLMFSYTKEFADHSVVNHIFDQDVIEWTGEAVKQNFHRRLFGPIGSELKRPQDTDLLIQCWGQLFKTKKFASIPFVDIRKVGTFEDGLYQMVIYNDCHRFVYIDKPFYHYRKTNEYSITTRFKPDLPEKYLNLYRIMDDYIGKYGLDGTYTVAVRNRVAINTLGLGLNSIAAPHCIRRNTLMGGGNFLNSNRVREALKMLDTSMMPLPWKVFYFLCKHNMIFLLTLMLLMIEFARTHQNIKLKNEIRC